MTFPASGAALASALTQAQQNALNLKYTATSFATRATAGQMSATDILNLLENLVTYKATFAADAALPGMDAYAQAQLGQTVGSDFTAMINAITTAGSWIITNFPKDASGYLLAEQFAGDGSRNPRMFTSAQLVGLVTALQALAATIN